MENQKINAHFERYLNHTAANAASKADLNCLEKIAAQNERYLNHNSQKALQTPLPPMPIGKNKRIINCHPKRALPEPYLPKRIPTCPTSIVDKQGYMSYHYEVPAMGHLYRLVYVASTECARRGLGERPESENCYSLSGDCGEGNCDFLSGPQTRYLG